MTADRIKEIQDKTAFPNSVSVCQALLQVWNECEQERMYSEAIEFAEWSNRKEDKSKSVLLKIWFEQFKKK